MTRVSRLSLLWRALVVGLAPGWSNHRGLATHRHSVCSIRRVTEQHARHQSSGLIRARPKIPNNWQFGQVASVLDRRRLDHVWILQRPGTPQRLHERARAAPPLLQFDSAGNFVRRGAVPVKGMNGRGTEHGVYVDPKGFVWIGGSGPKDNQVLKFTKSGQFVIQIGRAGQSKGNADTENLNQPADTFVYSKTNELFVADGYGNRRVIVFDADKR